MFHEPEKNRMAMLSSCRERRKAALSSGVIGSSPGSERSMSGAISWSLMSLRYLSACVDVSNTTFNKYQSERELHLHHARRTLGSVTSWRTDAL